MIYKCKHFKIEELVPPDVYNGEEDKDRLWMIFDILALKALDALRDRYGPAFVNTWHYEKNGFKNRGYRAPDCTVGARYSQHRFGRAFDVSFRDVSAEEVRGDARNTPYPQFQHFRRIEEDVSWLHFDTGNYFGEGIKFFKP